MIRAFRLPLLAATALLLAGPAGLAQGSLTPPGAPAPTQHTLEELWQLVGQVETRNAALRAENLRQRRLLALLAPDRLAWQIETVRRFGGDVFTGEAFSHTALAFDANGRPAIAYQNLNSGGYSESSTLADATWAHARNALARDFGAFTSLAFSPSGELCVAAYNTADQDLGFARIAGPTVRYFDLVDTVGDVGRYASLAFDANGRPAIAYYDATNADLKLARYNGVTWSTATVTAPGDTPGDVGSHAKLVFFNGQPAIVALDATNGQIVFYRYDGSAWTRQPVRSVSAPFRGLSVALDAAGQPTVLASEADGQLVQYCTRYVGGSWSNTLLGSVAGTALSHAFGPDGQLAVAYRDRTTGALHYFHATAPTGLGTQIVDAGSSQGVDYCSLVFAPDGQPAIAYYDKSTGSVKYAHRGVFTAQ